MPPSWTRQAYAYAEFPGHNLNHKAVSRGICLSSNPSPASPALTLFCCSVFAERKTWNGIAKNLMAISACCFLGNITKWKPPRHHFLTVSRLNQARLIIIIYEASQRVRGALDAQDKPRYKMRRANHIDLSQYLWHGRSNPHCKSLGRQKDGCRLHE